MKQIKLFVLFLTIVALSAGIPLSALGNNGGGTPVTATAQEGEDPGGDGIAGGFKCGSGTVPAQPGSLGDNTDACTGAAPSCNPITPPPTTWANNCCTWNNSGTCTQIQHRWQCCPSWNWKHYYKSLLPVVDNCTNHVCG